MLKDKIANVFDYAINVVENEKDEFMLLKMQGRVQKGCTYKSEIVIDGDDYENELVYLLKRFKAKILTIVEEEQNEL